MEYPPDSPAVQPFADELHMCEAIQSPALI
jgi:hypothetical protein